MENRILKAITALILIITLTFADIIVLGQNVISYAIELYRTTNENNVEFMAYFVTKDGEKVTELKDKMDSESMKIYLEVSVNNEGYLNGNIKIEESNFYFDTNTKSDAINKITENEIILNQVVAGETEVLEIPIKPIKAEEYKLDLLKKKCRISISGKYSSSKKKDTDIKAERNIILTLENPYEEIEENQSLENKEVENTKENKEITQKSNVLLESKVVTNKIYQIDGKEKRIIQLEVTSSLDGNKYPIKSTEIEADCFAEVEKVEVGSRGTNATNANSIEINDKNYSLNKDTNKLNIEIKNEEIQNDKKEKVIKWSQTGEDKILITYLIDKEEKLNEKEIEIKSTITLYDTDETKYNSETKCIIEKEIDGAVAIEEIKSDNSIYKGNMYLGKETEFKNTVKLDIRNNYITNKIVIYDDEINFAEANEIDAKITYKSIIFKKSQIDNILGKKGILNIERSDGTIIAEVTSKTTADENGNIEAIFSENNIQIEIIDPENEGELVITNDMTIKFSNTSKEEIDELSELKINTKLKSYKENKIVEENDVQIKKDETLIEEKNEITKTNDTKQENINNKKLNIIEKEISSIKEVKDTITYAQIITENETLSTLQTNQNVVFNVILKSDDIKYDLYKNPKIMIEFPNGITDLKINSVNPLYSDEMKLGKPTIGTNENGKKVIEVNLTGEQTKYTNTISEGIVLSFDLDITFDKTLPSQISEVKLIYTNENGKENEYYSTIPISLQSKYGILTYTTISNEDESQKYAEILNGEEATIEIQAHKEIDMKFKGTVINNYNRELKNVEIIGQIPTGEKIETELKDKIELINSNDIELKKIQIYYSTKIDVESNDDSWTTDIQNTNDIKAYKIIIDELLPQEVVQFNYSFRTNETTDYDKTAISQNNVSYVYFGSNRYVYTNLLIHSSQKENVSDSEINDVEKNNYEINDRKDLDVKNEENINETDVEEKKDITINFSVTRGNKEISSKDIVYQGEKILYHVTITNNSNNTLRNVKIITKNSNAVLYEPIEGEVKDWTDVDENKNPITKKTYIYGETDKKEKELAIIEEMQAGESVTYEFQTSVLQTNENENISILNISADNMEEVSSILSKNKIEKADIKLTTKYLYSEDTDVYVKEKFHTVVNIENLSDNAIQNIYVNINFVENLKYESSIYDEDKVEFVKLENNILTLKILEINPKENILIHVLPEIQEEGICKVISEAIQKGKTYESNVCQIKAKKDLNSEMLYNAVYNRIQNDETKSVNISSDDTETKLKNNANEQENVLENSSKTQITAKIDKSLNNILEEDSTYKHKIYGVAWIDENNNGKKDKSEPILQGIKVKLLDAETGTQIIDNDGKEIEQTTDEYGKYMFEVDKGKYIVCFEYDSENYDVTMYQKLGVQKDQSSFVLNKEIKEDGVIKNVALTDILEVSNMDLTYVNMGIKKKNIFDLSLQKQITKVIVQNNKGTEIYDNKKTDLAKVEIDPEYYIGSMVIVEYSISVTNEGDIDGYVNDIVDYLPSTFKFNSELNKDWYLSDDGNLHNISLENEKILAGETKEVKLVLTKTLENEEETGKFSNTAEIAKSSNEEGVDDVDSVQNNKAQEEDDISTASIIITITTGRTLQYLFVVTIVIIAILSIVYFINKKIIKLK